MSDELASNLRELAQGAETPPPVPGAEIRLRAVRRRRRRRTAVTVTGACAAAGLALVVTLNLVGGGHETRPSPAASPTAAPTPPPSTPAAPDATVDLARRVLTVAGRELPISSGTVRYPTPTGRMTVVTKEEAKAVSALEGKYVTKMLYVIGLRAYDGKTNFIAALTAEEKAPGNYEATNGWIGLRRADAQWLYEELMPGAVVEIAGSAVDPSTGTDVVPSVAADSALPGGVGGTSASSGRIVDSPVPSEPSEPSVATEASMATVASEPSMATVRPEPTATAAVPAG